MNRRFLVLAGAAGAVGVAAGALGGHALAERLSPKDLATFETGVRYHLVHAPMLAIVALLMGRLSTRFLSFAGWAFLAGIVLFSGSLYALALSGPRWVGPLTPIGGAAFIAGWLSLAAAGLRSRIS